MPRVTYTPHVQRGARKRSLKLDMPKPVDVAVDLHDSWVDYLHKHYLVEEENARRLASRRQILITLITAFLGAIVLKATADSSLYASLSEHRIVFLALTFVGAALGICTIFDRILARAWVVGTSLLFLILALVFVLSDFGWGYAFMAGLGFGCLFASGFLALVALAYLLIPPADIPHQPPVTAPPAQDNRLRIRDWVVLKWWKLGSLVWESAKGNIPKPYPHQANACCFWTLNSKQSKHKSPAMLACVSCIGNALSCIFQKKCRTRKRPCCCPTLGTYRVQRCSDRCRLSHLCLGRGTRPPNSKLKP